MTAAESIRRQLDAVKAQESALDADLIKFNERRANLRSQRSVLEDLYDHAKGLENESE